MVTKAAPKTRQQQMDERRADLDWMAQMQAAHEAERAEQQKKQDDFQARVDAYHDRIDSYIRHSWAQRSDVPMSEHQMNALRGQIEQEAYAQVRPTIPTINQIYESKAAEEQAAKEEAERQRIAALTPKEVWLSTLTWDERQRIAKYEQINRMPWPYAPV